MRNWRITCRDFRSSHATYRWKENLPKCRPLLYGISQDLSAQQVYRFCEICQGITGTTLHLRSWLVLYCQNATRFHSTGNKCDFIYNRTKRTAFPAPILMETHTRSAALTIYRLLMSNFTPKSENKCGYVSTATNLRPDVGTTSTAPTFT